VIEGEALASRGELRSKIKYTKCPIKQRNWSRWPLTIKFNFFIANKEKILIAIKKFSLEANKLTNKLACKLKDSGTRNQGCFPIISAG
jgi:hypothetical protein